MKMMIAALALVALSGAALAQEAAPPAPSDAAPAAGCPALAEPPALPDAATARNAEVMNAGSAAYQAWANPYLEALNCRRDAFNALGEQVRLLQAQREAIRAEHEAGAATLNRVGQEWVAEQEEYNARGGRRDPRAAR